MSSFEARDDGTRVAKVPVRVGRRVLPTIDVVGVAGTVGTGRVDLAPTTSGIPGPGPTGFTVPGPGCREVSLRDDPRVRVVVSVAR